MKIQKNRKKYLQYERMLAQKSMNTYTYYSYHLISGQRNQRHQGPLPTRQMTGVMTIQKRLRLPEIVAVVEEVITRHVALHEVRILEEEVGEEASQMTAGVNVDSEVEV